MFFYIYMLFMGVFGVIIIHHNIKVHKQLMKSFDEYLKDYLEELK